MKGLKARFSVQFPGFHLDADFEIPNRGVTVIFGPSGCGKTTLLRCLAGLERSPNGFLQVGEDIWQDESRSRFRPVHHRPLGMVFQEARLFPHLSVRANLEYGWKRIRPQDRRLNLEQVVGILGLEKLLERRPGRLSGGEQQRVALGRSLLTSPRLLLLDEPLANLDLERKLEILPFLTRVRKELDIPMVYVSHSLTEVLQLVDTLMWMRRGGIMVCGPANEVLSNVRGEPGASLPLKGSVLETHVVDHDPDFALTRVKMGNHHLWVPLQDVRPGNSLRLYLRAQDISLTSGAPQTPTSVLNILPARVLDIGPDRTGDSSVDIQLDVGVPVLATITRKSLHQLNLEKGQQVYAHIKAIRTVHALEEN